MNTTMRRGEIAAVLFFLLMFSACAAGSGEAHHAAMGGPIAQFLLGLWHGAIAPLMLVVELVNRFKPGFLPWTVRFYEARDTLAEYDLGFYIGLSASPIFAWSRWPRRVQDG